MSGLMEYNGLSLDIPDLEGPGKKLLVGAIVPLQC